MISRCPAEMNNNFKESDARITRPPQTYHHPQTVPRLVITT